jgi:hypothetical protein
MNQSINQLWVGVQERLKKAVGRARKTATPAVSFEAPAEAGRKRSAEWGLANQVAGLRVLVEGLVKQY